MAFDAKEFITSILKDSKIDDTKKNILLEVSQDPSVAKKFQELHENGLRQSEFSKKMDDYNKKVKGVQDYWTGLVEWKTTKETEFQEELDKVKRTSSSPYSWDDDDSSRKQFDPTALQKQFDDKIRLMENNFIDYNNVINTIGLKHFKEFGEVLDMNKLKETAQSEGLNVVSAYERMVQPAREEKATAYLASEREKLDKEYAQKVELARQEGRTEALKNAGLPVSDTAFNSGVPHALDKVDADRKPVNESDSKYGWKAAVGQFGEDKRTGKILPHV